MTRSADGLLAALKDADFVNAYDREHAARVVSRWLADHLDALAESGRHGRYDAWRWREAAAEIRAAGGVS